LNLFGFTDFQDLRERLHILPEGFDSDGRSFFCHELIILPNLKIPRERLLQYDEAIKNYADQLSKNRRQQITWKYFQYLALLFSEIFFDFYFNDREKLLNALNDFLKEFNSHNEHEINKFTEDDLKKLAFWMATGSGKTLIMHVNYWQFFKHCKEKFDNIILITPNEGLTKQHYEEMKKSGIPCKAYDGNLESLKTHPGQVLIIDIYKLTQEKKGEGVTIDISYFDGKNLVFIDEGHKGQSTEEQKWKKLRERIGENGFIFEYSATLGQVIGKNKELLEEYAKSIIFDYSYKYFYTDGYGKDFYVFNLKEDAYSQKYADLLLTADLLSFYEQYILFENNKEKLKDLNIEKPLWVFVGSKVSGKGIDSDVIKVILFLKKILEDETYLRNNIDIILKGKSGLVDKEGKDIFEDKFKEIRKYDLKTNLIYEKIFRGKGSLELYEIKNAEGEIALKTATSRNYFGVVNVGDVLSVKKLLKEEGLEVREDVFSPSLFFNINSDASPINILIGSKKFIEGWDSWRVSSMSLLNMGKGEGPQIIQLFGRGVRLKGRDYSLKREENPDYVTRALQTIFIFGLNADYIQAFLEMLKTEELEYEEIPVAIKYNERKKWENRLYNLRSKTDYDFAENIVKLEFDPELLSTIHVDLRPKIGLAHGLETGMAEGAEDFPFHFQEWHLNLVDWNDIYLETMNYKIAKGYYNLLINKDVLKKIIESNKFKLFITQQQASLTNFEDRYKFQNFMLSILRDYIDKFYRRAEKQKIMENLMPYPLDTNDENLNFGELIIKVPKSMADQVKNILKDSEKLYKQDIREIPTIHFDKHLYTPLIAYKKGKEFLKSSPVKLNEGETKFIEDLRKYVVANKSIFSDKELFVLRNLSRRGIGFFRSAGFYPDFIIWIKENGSQKILFIDPKSIRNMGNFNDEKIQICTAFIKDIETRIREEMERRGKSEKIQLFGFIISVSNFDSIRHYFGNGKHTKEEFNQHNIYFINDEGYLNDIFSKVL